MHAARRHTFMLGINYYGDTTRLQHPLNHIGDLLRHGFLRLQPLGEYIEQPRNFADTDDIFIGQIGDMRPANDRHHVMLAMRFKRHVFQQHDFIIALHILKRFGKNRVHILIIPGVKLAVGIDHALRRIAQTLALWVIPRPANQGANGLLRLLRRGAGSGARLDSALSDS